MKVRERMTVPVISITTDTSVADAMALMREKGIKRLPVLEKGKLVGIVTLMDLSENAPSPATTLSIFEASYLLARTLIKDILPKRPVITVDADANLELAALLMRQHNIGGLPVVSQGKVVGIITEGNIFDAFIDILGVNRPGTRIDLEVGERVGTVADITRIIADQGVSIENIVLNEKGKANYDFILRVATLQPEPLIKALKDQGYTITEVTHRQ
ncbi:MAG: CBS domain-containing protein [Methylocystaceae bacterium]